MREFKLDEVLDLPLSEDVSTHSVELDNHKFHLHIHSPVPTWLVTDEIGNRLMDELYKRGTIREAIERTTQSIGTSPEIDRIVQTSPFSDLNIQELVYEEAEILLNDVEAAQFYRDSNSVRDIPVIEKLDAQVKTTNRCNLRCTHCVENSGRANENELTTGEMTRFIRDYDDLTDTGWISFSGGEFFTRPDALGILRYAKKLGLNTTVLTNGIHLINEENVRAIVRPRRLIDEIHISLDGATPEDNDRIRGRGTYEQIIRAIHNVGDYGIPTVVKITVTPDNAQGLLHYFDELTAMFTDYPVSYRVSPLEEGGRCHKAYRDETVLGSLIQKIHEMEMVEQYDEDKIKGIKMLNCGVSKTMLVTDTGDVKPCLVSEKIAAYAENLFGRGLEYHVCGNIREDPLRYIAERMIEFFYMTSVENMPGCRECDVEYICAGGRRCAPECNPQFKENFYKLLVLTDLMI